MTAAMLGDVAVITLMASTGTQAETVTATAIGAISAMTATAIGAATAALRARKR